jgi:hypothetical protein
MRWTSRSQRIAVLHFTTGLIGRCGVGEKGFEVVLDEPGREAWRWGRGGGGRRRGEERLLIRARKFLTFAYAAELRTEDR